MGFIYSQDSILILEFLERHGPASFPALLDLAICQGWNKDGKKVRAMHRLGLAFKELQMSRSAFKLVLDKQEFWFPDGYIREHGNIDPAKQDVIARQAVQQEKLAARLEEVGGRLENGVAVFPSGVQYPVRYDIDNGVICFGNDLCCHFDDLRDKDKAFKDCIRTKKNGK
jgi:hypothetical protein